MGALPSLFLHYRIVSLAPVHLFHGSSCPGTNWDQHYSIIPFSLQSGGDSAFPMLLISILLHSLLLSFKFFQQLCKNFLP